MKIENQVCTLGQAKKLTSLGVSNQSYLSYKGLCDHDPDLKSDDRQDYPAFTVSELGTMLPSETLTIRRGSENSGYANWEWENEGAEKGWGLFATEAEARAHLLVYLLESNGVTAEEVNQRLAS